MALLFFIGNFDCMDWSDELFFNYGEFCSLTANTFECDEHLCYQGWYSCGDGQCIIFVSHIVFQRVVPAYQNCFNKRNLNYMCEANAHEPSWTLDDGLCWTGETYDDPRYSPWNSIDSANMTEERKCEYLVRCLLSNGLEFDCPCNRENCSLVVKDECKKKGGFVQYPPEGLISGNMRFFYDPTDSSNSNAINRLELGGRVRCRGFHLTTSEYYEYPFHYIIAGGLRINTFLCALDSEIHMEKDHESPFQFDKFCWNNSLTFNGRPYAVYPDTCEAGDICISQYRIRDGYGDCVNGEDEKNVFGKSFCLPQVGRHRFQCYDDENKCLPNFYLGTGLRKCSNNYDKVWYGVGVSLQETRRCRKEFSSDCLILQEYIRQSSIKDFRQNISDVNRTQRVSTNQMAFQFYCNSFWELGDSKDEDPVLCEKWICRKDQYKCRNGQCIPLDWLCDGEWDCADASDEEAIELIDIWSTHNQRLHGLSERRELCRKRYSKSPFSTICNTSFEFGCFLSGVEDPLSIRLKRPCINLAKIGDGHEDCYNGYDEKNVFKTDSGYAGMWGFNFRCENQTVLHSLACSVAYDRCNRVLCANRRSTNGLCPGISDAWCLEENRCVRNGRCNGIPECFHGEDEYWCPRDPMNIHSFYRTDKLARWKSFKFDFHLPYPQLNITKEKQSQHKDVIMSTEMFPVHHSYICNRGITILVLNEERCLCPPAFYGKRCEFFNDRITVIAILDRKILPKTNRKTILKIKAILFFNNLVIDFDEFLVNPTFESAKRIKHRFYLLYSRSNRMLEHKRWRYFNRTDIIEYHPYSVHFVAFALTDEREIAELGSWIYTIYFDYIPAFRLAIVLKFPYWFDNQALDLCQNSSCTANSVCKPIFNGNRTHYCSCKNGYYGENCQFYESRCQISCSSNAFCQIFYDHHRLNRTKIHCICPLDHFGRGCFLKNDNCEPNPCLNDGACFSTYSRSGENPFICRCSEKFYGQRCEQPKAKVRVRLEAPMLSAVKATAVQLLNVKTGTWTLVIEYQEFHLGLLSMVNYFHSDMSAPSIGLLKTLDDRHQVEVLVLYVLRQDNIDIGSVPSRCVSIPSQIAESIVCIFSSRMIHLFYRFRYEWFDFIRHSVSSILCQRDRTRVFLR